MLSDEERKTFDVLVAQFDRETVELSVVRRSEPSADELAARRLCSRLLRVGMGVCVAAIAVSGLVGSPEAVLSFSGGMAALTFLRYA